MMKSSGPSGSIGTVKVSGMLDCPGPNVRVLGSAGTMSTPMVAEPP